MRHPRLLSSALALLAPAAPALSQATFVEMGPSPAKDSRVWAMSGGAEWFAGEMWTPSIAAGGARHAFRWDGVGNPEDLGELPGGADDSGAKGISDDASIVVGDSQSANGMEAFRWESATGMVGLGDLAGGDFRSYATGITADGSWVVGLGTDATGGRAVRWDASGTIELLGGLPYGNGTGVATAVTPTGDVIVGMSHDGSDGFPFRWTAAGGVQPLGDLLPMMLAGRAEGVSDDGQVVVGQAIVDAGVGGGAVYIYAYRYTVGGSMQNLGILSGERNVANAMDCSGDGSVVVGGNITLDLSASIATIWDEVNGLRSLEDVLVNDYGLDLNGFEPWVASKISADGTTITGYGVNNHGYFRGFLATIPAPCPTPYTYCASLPNSTGLAEVIGHTGTTSIATNDFTLVAQDGVPSQFGLFFFGPNEVQLPWGDGYRCVGGGVNRLTPAGLSDALGTSTKHVDFTAPSAAAITVGSTWKFQHWYRDPSGPGGTGFNLSDALSATFCP